MEFVINKELFPREKYLSKKRGFYHEYEIISGIAQDNILDFIKANKNFTTKN